jgi:hypothetical protein
VILKRYNKNRVQYASYIGLLYETYRRFIDESTEKIEVVTNNMMKFERLLHREVM